MSDTATPLSASFGYDVATSLWQGRRPYQEDTLLADFHGGVPRGFAVLADGMGGHAAGDLASRLVVIDAVSHLKFLMHDGEALEANLKTELKSAVETANEVISDRVSQNSRVAGMGATFLATVMFEDRLYWASVGDSPLYLWRGGELRQLNQDHSMAPIIDQMAKAGEITAVEAREHPDRNALTSVLMGRPIKTMDIPDAPTMVKPGDIVIQASDGLQYLDAAKISAEVAAAGAGASSRAICDRLMRALHVLDDPAQDNTAILVLQLTEGDVPGGGTAVVEAGNTAMASERAMEAAAAAPAAAMGVSEAAAAPPVAASVAAPRRPPDKPAPGGRRWGLPVAFVAAGAIGLGLYFGLPRDDAQLDPVAASIPEAGTEPPATTAAPVAEAAPDAAPEGAPDAIAADPATNPAAGPAETDVDPDTATEAEAAPEPPAPVVDAVPADEAAAPEATPEPATEAPATADTTPAPVTGSPREQGGEGGSLADALRSLEPPAQDGATSGGEGTGAVPAPRSGSVVESPRAPETASEPAQGDSPAQAPVTGGVPAQGPTEPPVAPQPAVPQQVPQQVVPQRVPQQVPQQVPQPAPQVVPQPVPQPLPQPQPVPAPRPQDDGGAVPGIGVGPLRPGIEGQTAPPAAPGQIPLNPPLILRPAEPVIRDTRIDPPMRVPESPPQRADLSTPEVEHLPPLFTLRPTRDLFVVRPGSILIIRQHHRAKI